MKPTAMIESALQLPEQGISAGAGVVGWKLEGRSGVFPTRVVANAATFNTRRGRNAFVRRVA